MPYRRRRRSHGEPGDALHIPLTTPHLLTPPVTDDEAEKALRRTSYMQATKEAPMDVEEK